MNVVVGSYLRIGDGKFVPIESVEKPEIAHPRHIDGAIELTINGTAILDTSLWDLIDQLWAYIADMLVVLAQRGESRTYFPDQPIQLTFKRIGETVVRVSCDVNHSIRSAVIDEVTLTSTLRDAGLIFFAKMQELVPEYDYTAEIERLTKK